MVVTQTRRPSAGRGGNVSPSFPWRENPAPKAPASIARPNTMIPGPVQRTAGPAPAPAQIYTGGGGGGGYSGGGGGYSGGGGGGGAAPSYAPPPMTDDEYLGTDTGYQATIKALEAKMKEFETENTFTKDKGTRDYKDSSKRLGWIDKTGDVEGRWNQEDRTTGYGNAYQGQMGDFASRGMLQSSLYDQSRSDMLSDFTRQKGDMDTAQTSFLDELARALSGKKADSTLGKDQARIEALARRSAVGG
jgi:hypothetical protein